jgi:putative transposase
MKQEERLDYEQMKTKALEQLRSGKSLYGKEGAFAPLLKSFLDAALEAELESHLNEGERSSGNRRNGRTSKEVRTSDGRITVNTPRDRHSSFEPEIIRKRETILAESLESKIIGMYGLGISLRDISKHIKDM